MPAWEDMKELKLRILMLRMFQNSANNNSVTWMSDNMRVFTGDSTLNRHTMMKHAMAFYGSEEQVGMIAFCLSLSPLSAYVCLSHPV